MPPKKPTKPSTVQSSGTLVDAHKQLLQSLRKNKQDLAFLGHARAVVIVCSCANTTPVNLSNTLQEAGVDGNSFQTCVFSSVIELGYSIRIDDIPDSPDTKLIKVVSIIQNSPKSD